MPSKGMTWELAMDWLMRVRAAPDDAALSSALKQWLAQSEVHARAYRKAEKVWRLTGEVGPAHAERWQTLGGQSVDSWEQPSSRTSPSERRWPKWAAGMAAAAAMVLLGPTLSLITSADHRTGTGEFERVALSDGSVAQLNAKSALSVRYSSAVRAVDLFAGQAFFDVQADTVKPFVVHAGDFSVAVVGTAFDVHLTDDSLSVTVARGTVRVSGPGIPGTLLPPGTRLVVAMNGDGRAQLDQVPIATIGSWQQGRLMVHDALLSEVVDELRRHHDGVILLAGAGLNSHRVTGIYDLHRPVESLATLVQPYGGVVRTLTPYVALVSVATTP